MRQSHVCGVVSRLRVRERVRVIKRGSRNLSPVNDSQCLCVCEREIEREGTRTKSNLCVLCSGAQCTRNNLISHAGSSRCELVGKTSDHTRRRLHTLGVLLGIHRRGEGTNNLICRNLGLGFGRRLGEDTDKPRDVRQTQRCAR